jgi:arylsulfatase
LKSKGLIPADIKVAPRLDGEPAWDELSSEKKKIEARKMEIFAAMVDQIDVHVGRVIDALKVAGEYNNTVIFFMSDNGSEGHHVGTSIPPVAKWVEICCDNSFENMGKAKSYVWQGPNWARAGSAPFRMFKGFTTEGGIRVPALVHYPKWENAGTVNNSYVSLMDIMPTILDIAGAQHPGTRYKDRDVLPMQGKSMWPMLSAKKANTHEENYATGWELNGKKAYRKGKWKIVKMPKPFGNGDWQLYDVVNDQGEQTDLAAINPTKVKELIALWDQYAVDNGVIMSNELMNY